MATHKFKSMVSFDGQCRGYDFGSVEDMILGRGVHEGRGRGELH